MSDANAVTLVIPGRDASATIDACLSAVTPLLGKNGLKEIIFVDDGSVDDTAARVAKYPVRCVTGFGEGPGAARNLGWREAKTPLVWFIDSDCESEPDALSLLLDHMSDPKVAGVGGSYGNMRPDSLLACLIHEEIIERHMVMPTETNFLATFNVVYRRSVLKAMGGFDERFLTAEDADLSFRIREAGHLLHFDMSSKVKHHHPVNPANYFKTQARHGYWRAWLYFAHPDKISGDSYSDLADHVQPPLAVLSLALAPSLLLGPLSLVQAPIITALAAAQIPMTQKIVRRTGNLNYAAFAPMSVARAYARGFGFAKGAVAALKARVRGHR